MCYARPRPLFIIFSTPAGTGLPGWKSSAAVIRYLPVFSAAVVALAGVGKDHPFYLGKCFQIGGIVRHIGFDIIIERDDDIAGDGTFRSAEVVCLSAVFDDIRQAV